MAKGTPPSAEKLYHQLLELLQELAAVSAEPDTEEEDDEGVEAMDEEDLITMLVEEGVEHGLDEETTERVFKSVAVFARKAAEG